MIPEVPGVVDRVKGTWSASSLHRCPERTPGLHASIPAHPLSRIALALSSLHVPRWVSLAG